MSYSSVILADTPLAYYRMNATSGTSETDQTDNGHTGTYHQTTSGGYVLDQPSVINDPTDSAVEFVSADKGYLELDTLGNFGQALPAGSAEFWIETTNQSSMQCVFGSVGINTGGTSENLFECFINRNLSGTFTAQRLWIEVRSSGGQTNPYMATVNVMDGKRHHCVWVMSGTFTSALMSLYVDGSPVSVSSTFGNPLNFTTAFVNFGYPMTIGAENLRSSIDSWIDATIDEVAFYAYSLTAQQVTNHFEAGLPAPAIEYPTEAELAVYGSSAALTDYTSDPELTNYTSRGAVVLPTTAAAIGTEPPQ